MVQPNQSNVDRSRASLHVTPPCLYLTPSVCNNLKHLYEPPHPNTDEPQRLRHQHKNKGSTGSTRCAVERNQSVATPAAESVGTCLAFPAHKKRKSQMSPIPASHHSSTASSRPLARALVSGHDARRRHLRCGFSIPGLASTTYARK